MAASPKISSNLSNVRFEVIMVDFWDALRESKLIGYDQIVFLKAFLIRAKIKKWAFISAYPRCGSGY